MIFTDCQRCGVTGGREDVNKIGLWALKKLNLWQLSSYHSNLNVIRSTHQIIANSASTRSHCKKTMYRICIQSRNRDRFSELGM